MFSIQTRHLIYFYFDKCLSIYGLDMLFQKIFLVAFLIIIISFTLDGYLSWN